jgi:hypothetical protein
VCRGPVHEAHLVGASCTAESRSSSLTVYTKSHLVKGHEPLARESRLTWATLLLWILLQRNGAAFPIEFKAFSNESLIHQLRPPGVHLILHRATTHLHLDLLLTLFCRLSHQRRLKYEVRMENRMCHRRRTLVQR